MLQVGWQTGCDISADGFHGYAQAIEKSFGTDGDYGQIVKVYGTYEFGERFTA
jgi:hypothetical protein